MQLISIFEGSMPIHMPHVMLHPSMVYPESLYIDDDSVNANADNDAKNNFDDAAT